MPECHCGRWLKDGAELRRHVREDHVDPMTMGWDMEHHGNE